MWIVTNFSYSQPSIPLSDVPGQTYFSISSLTSNRTPIWTGLLFSRKLVCWTATRICQTNENAPRIAESKIVLTASPRLKLAQRGSTKTGPFYGLRHRLVHAVNLQYYEAKAEIEQKISPPTSDLSASFEVTT